MMFITFLQLLLSWSSAQYWVNGDDGKRSDSYILEKLEKTGHRMFYIFAKESNPWKQEITCRRYCHKDSEGVCTRSQLKFPFFTQRGIRFTNHLSLSSSLVLCLCEDI
jgi:hypothetical protein